MGLTNSTRKIRYNRRQDPQQQHQSILACFQNELVMFLISSFLPGEYVLRVLPSICKSTQSHRLSLSLLESRRSRCDLTRLLTTPHCLTALFLEGSEILLFKARNFPRVEALQLSIHNAKGVSIDSFPNLTTLDVILDSLSEGDILSAIWELPLQFLSIDCQEHFYYGVPDFHPRPRAHPPAFARGLRSLRTHFRYITEVLSGYCHSLQEFHGYDDHGIIVPANSSSLTSLQLSHTNHNPSALDLTPFTLLKKLSLRGVRRFFSQEPLLNLEDLQLRDVDALHGTQFLMLCHAVKHVALDSEHWKDIAQMTSVLAPSVRSRGAPRLTLSCQNPPSFDQVNQQIVKKGFQINNPEFLFCTKNGPSNWKKILQCGPNLKKIRMEIPDGNFAFVSSFPMVSLLTMQSSTPWNQRKLRSVVKQCSLLASLHLKGKQRSDVLELESQSLCNLTLKSPFSQFKLMLPNLTRLNILPLTTDVSFLQSLLDGDPLIHLPQLRTLVMIIADDAWMEHFSIRSALTDSLHCRVGHKSLTELTVHGQDQTIFYNVTLRNLPRLKSVTLGGIDECAIIDLQLPGECDICFGGVFMEGFIRKGCLDQSDFIAVMKYDKQAGLWVNQENTPELLCDNIVHNIFVNV